jgi:hypothetical protein
MAEVAAHSVAWALFFVQPGTGRNADYVEPLLGSDRKISKYTRAVAG